MRWTLLVVLGVSVGFGCRPERLSVATAALSVATQELDFGTLRADGRPREAVFEVRNEGVAPLELTWSDAAPFELDAFDVLRPGAHAVRVQVTPVTAGTLMADVELVADNGDAATVRLRAVVVPPVVCEPSSPCVTARFDDALERCVETPVTDGTDCASDDRCLVDTRCEAGQCVGRALDCDDGNACTDDVCNAERGCESAPAAPCPGDGACMEGVCDPAAGCGLAPRADGESCGERYSCTEVQVCLAGACVARTPPDGYVCAEATPCQAAGRCEGQTCVRAWAHALTASTFPLSADYTELVLEPSGDVSVSGATSAAPLLRVTGAAVPQQRAAGQSCLLFAGQHVCLDDSHVVASDLNTGATTWTFSPTGGSAAATPRQLVAVTSGLLAVIAERSGPAWQSCPDFEIVILDSHGQAQRQWQSQARPGAYCEAAHTEAIADRRGNLYLSFRARADANKGTAEEQPTGEYARSWTIEGVLRWTFYGSCDAPSVAGDRLFCGANSVLNAATGVPLARAPGSGGQLVATSSRVVVGPSLSAGNTLTGFDRALTPKWTAQLDTGCFTPVTRELRLASWTTTAGPKEVALVWRTAVCDLPAGDQLVAFDTETGAEVFTCAVDTQLPLLMRVTSYEVGAGTTSVLTGAAAKTLLRFTTPTLSASTAPWPGRAGGPSQERRER